MEILKRDGSIAKYEREKIAIAMRKSFGGSDRMPSNEQFETMVKTVEDHILEYPEKRNVESIQDAVEQTLMSQGFFNEAKSYILFRYQRTELRNTLNSIVEEVGEEDLTDCLKGIVAVYRRPEYSIMLLAEKFFSFSKPGMKKEEKIGMLIKAAVEMTTQEAPDWEFIAGRLLTYKLHREIKIIEENLGLRTLFDKMRYLTDEKLLGEYILDAYNQTEIEEAATFMQQERDNLLNYSGLDLLSKRYLIRTYDRRAIESIQEMYLGIALHLAMNEERSNRLVWVRRFYDMLSQLHVTMATPTLSNARKPFHQLSSCFIDTVPDSLDGIYRSIDNFAQVSKFGGGMGMYFGKVRASGAKIRGFKGAAGGVIRWMKLVNDTAVAVDQLGMRQGACAVYLDVWHRDLPEFLQLRTNNGDDRMKAHDIFPAVCYPDLFWRMAEESLDLEWHMFCPNEIMSVRGYCLEDYYGEEWERRYMECVADLRITRRVMSIKDIVRLILKSAVETGTPFTFNRDLVNRANPNNHCGIIYCSNLCTEIAQNMSQIEQVSSETTTVDGETVIVETTKPGDFVVCNLASLSMGHLPLEDDAQMKDIVEAVVRALDNVIDLNFYPLHYARITNQRYRAIGLGVSGYHHALALRGIKWESDRHLEWTDEVFDRINRCAVETSAEIAAEKGSYLYFEGSDWNTGAYFTKRNYTSPEWQAIAQKAQQGMRNAYLLAIAPTSSTSILAGTTAGIDPVMQRFFLEEKKGAMLPRVAPGLNDQTYWMYKGAYLLDQSWSVRASGIRQRHIDQAQSMNLYITQDYSMRQILSLYLLAWKSGVKTIYYVRSKSLEVEECESCAS